jgi:hypothetical protein
MKFKFLEMLKAAPAYMLAETNFKLFASSKATLSPFAQRTTAKCSMK